jgi:hypothetical protein
LISKSLRLRGVLLACAVSCALAAPASAVTIAGPDTSCFAQLTDSAGNVWSLDGTSGAAAYVFSSRAVGRLSVGGSTYSVPPFAGCERAQGGREVVYPGLTLGNAAATDFAAKDANTLQVSRRVYVPADGEDFARYLDVFRNDGEQAVTMTVDYGSSSYGASPAFTSSGDDVVADGDRWAVRNPGGRIFIIPGIPGIPAIPGAPADGTSWTTLLDGAGATGPADRVTDDAGTIATYDLTVEPGKTAILMHVEHQASSPEAGKAFAERNDAGTAELLAGMSAADLGALRNWSDDIDGDGAANATDNCLGAANAGQGDADRDGRGDACDDDADGDGLSNDVETDLGTDPLKADTDGDGIVDRRDACPTKAGAGDGCPAPQVIRETQVVQGESKVVQVPVPASTTAASGTSALRGEPGRLTARTATREQRRVVRVRTTGTLVPPSGVSVAQACRSGVVEVVVKTGSLTISRRSVRLAPDCSYKSVVVVKRARLAGRTVTGKAYFLGNDVLGRRISE